MVKTILDNFCVKSGVLCPKCEEKVVKGQVSKLDLDIIQLLCEVEKDYPTIQEVTFNKAVEVILEELKTKEKKLPPVPRHPIKDK